MCSLNDALNDLGKLRIRTNVCKVDLSLSTAETKAAIDAFFYMLNNMLVPDVLAIPTGMS